jgi:hypothetical protein
MAYVTMGVIPEIMAIIFWQKKNVETQEMDCVCVFIYKYTWQHMTCTCNTISWGGGVYIEATSMKEATHAHF